MSGRFELLEILGRGGMGTVYAAHDTEFDRRVALKTLRELDPHALMRFKQEFRAVHDLQHPNLIRLGELLEQDGQWFFTMELVVGQDFLTHVCGHEHASMAYAQTLAAGSVTGSVDELPPQPSVPASSVDTTKLRQCLAQLALGLNALHAHGKIHRDVKPSNILVEEGGRVVLLDFGLIEDREQQEPNAAIVGTVIYMAPEQAAGKMLSPAADWYSVGVMLYRALTGRLPFTGSVSEIVLRKQSSQAPRPREVSVEISEDLDQLCVDLLQPEPGARPSGTEILARLGVSSATPQGLGDQVQVGRERELELLHAARRDTVAAPVMVWIVGESGVGKSALVQRFGEQHRALDPSTLILAGRCYEREELPYKSFDGIADALCRHLLTLAPAQVSALLPEHAELLASLFPVFGRVHAIAARVAERAAERVHELGSVEMRRLMFAALRDLLSRVAARHTLLLTIDDIQWGDADSRILMAELFSPPAAPKLLVLVTARANSVDEREVRAFEQRGVDVRRMSVSVLAIDHARELVGLLAPGLNAAQIEAIANEASGHPLLLREMIHHVEEHGQTTASMQLVDALWARAQRLPADARALLEILCLAGVPLSHEVARQAARHDHPSYERAAASLRALHFARTDGVRSSNTIEPYHDRIRECVGERLSERVAVELHRRLAQVLEQSGAAASDPHSLVRHFEAGGEPRRAAGHALAAAEQAAEVLAFETAAEFYKTALRLHEHEHQRERELQLALGEVLANAGHGHESARAFIRAAEGADPVTKLDCQEAAARQLLGSGYIEPGLEVLTAALEAVGVEMPATPKRALASLLWNLVKLRIRGRHMRPRVRAEIDPALFARLRVLQTAADGLAMVDSVQGTDFQSRVMLLALRMGDREEVAKAQCHHAAHLSVQGNRARARARVLLAEAERAFDGQVPAIWFHAWGWNYYSGGEYRACIDAMREVVRLMYARPMNHTAWHIGTARHIELYALRALGEFNQARCLLDDYVRDALRRDDRFSETSMRLSASLQWLAVDAPERVRVELEQTSWLPPTRRFHAQHLYQLECRSHLALYEGRVGSALSELQPSFLALGRSTLLYIQHFRIRARSLWARLCVAESSAKGLAEARGLVRKLEREQLPVATVHAAMIGAAISIREREREAALTQLRAGLAIADQQELALLAAVLRWRLSTLVASDERERLRVAARTWMRQQAVVDLERLARVFMPVPEGAGS